jgi:hypothetical protein
MPAKPGWSAWWFGGRVTVDFSGVVSDLLRGALGLLALLVVLAVPLAAVSAAILGLGLGVVTLIRRRRGSAEEQDGPTSVRDVGQTHTRR